jgi:Holliday junction resolvase RusA-like endonuclease
VNVGMMTDSRVVEFTVTGEPRSKQRPRVTKQGTYTPKETVEAERRVRNAWRALGVVKLEGQLLVRLEFFNGNKRRRDLDNMAKLIFDALNKEAFDDDYQVVGVKMSKYFTDPARARTTVRIEEVAGWPDERARENMFDLWDYADNPHFEL